MLIRRLITLLALTLLTACGGSDGPPPFTSQQVAERFAQVTGDELTGQPDAEANDVRALSLSGQADAVGTQANRYGEFTIFVAKDAAAGRDLYVKDLSGAPVRPDASGVYWRRIGGASGAWLAAKPFRNVVLQWQAGEERRLGEQWTRLAAALQSLTVPLDKLELPPADTPCQRQGIDPVAGKSGVCKLGRQTLVVVDRGTKLPMPGYEVRQVAVKLRRVIPAESRFSDPLRAKGRFALLSFRVRNTGQRPLGSILPTLVIGDARYAADDQAAQALAPTPPFPVQPADSARVVAPFDIPAAAVKTLRKTGGLLVAGADTGVSDLDTAPTIGRVRLIP